ncbi:MAG: PAS domain S-box protein [bacterium]|nr:PAS domain S-box protein [bacterium]
MIVKTDNLISIIKKRRWKIVDFCSQIGISRSTLYGWKNTGSVPKESLMREMAELLEVRVSDISDLKDSKKDEIINNISNLITSFNSIDEINKHKKKYDDVISVIEEAKNETLKINTIIKALFSSIGSHIYIKDPNLNYIMVNNKFKDGLGFNKTYNIAGKNDYDIYSYKDANNIIDKDQVVLKTLLPQINKECKLPGSRNKIDCLESRYPILDDNGNLLGIIGTYDDITELKKATSSQAILASALNESKDAYWMGTWNDRKNQLNFTFISDRAFLDIFEISMNTEEDKRLSIYRIKDMIDRSNVLSDEVEELRDLTKHKNKNGHIMTIEYKIVTASGKIKWIRDSRSKFNKVWYGVFSDITNTMNLQSYLDTPNEVIFVGRENLKTFEYKYDFLNNKTEEIYGLTKQEFIDGDWRFCVHDESIDILAQLDNERDINTIYKKKRKSECQLKIIHAGSGEERWVELNTYIKRQGFTAVHTGFVKDITELHLKDQKIKRLTDAQEKIETLIWMGHNEKQAGTSFIYDSINSEENLMKILGISKKDFFENKWKKCIDINACKESFIKYDIDTKADISPRAATLKTFDGRWIKMTTYETRFEGTNTHTGFIEDVTKEKEASWLSGVKNSLMEKSDNPIWLGQLIEDKSGVIKLKLFYTNQAVYDMFDMNKKEFCRAINDNPDMWEKYLFSDDVERVHKIIEEQHKKDDDYIEFTYKMKMLNGDIKYINESRFTFSVGSERFAGGIQRDITDEENRKEDNIFLSKCINDMHSGLVLFDYHTNKTYYANKKIAEIYDEKLEDIQKITRDEIIRRKAHKDTDVESILKNDFSKSNVINHNYKISINGKTKHVNAILKLIKYKNKDCVIANVEDVTEKKKNETANERLLKLINTSNQGFFSANIVDNKYEYVFISNGVCDIYELPKQAFFDNPKIWQTRVRKDYLHKILEEEQKCFRIGCPYHAITPIVFDDGREKWVETTLQIYDSNEFLGVVIDVTEQRKC